MKTAEQELNRLIQEEEEMEAELAAFSDAEIVEQFKRRRDALLARGGDVARVTRDAMQRAVLKSTDRAVMSAEPDLAREFTWLQVALDRLRRKSTLTDQELAALDVR